MIQGDIGNLNLYQSSFSHVSSSSGSRLDDDDKAPDLAETHSPQKAETSPTPRTEHGALPLWLRDSAFFMASYLSTDPYSKLVFLLFLFFSQRHKSISLMRKWKELINFNPPIVVAMSEQDPPLYDRIFKIHKGSTFYLCLVQGFYLSSRHGLPELRQILDLVFAVYTGSEVYFWILAVLKYTDRQ